MPHRPALAPKSPALRLRGALPLFVGVFLASTAVTGCMAERQEREGEHDEAHGEHEGDGHDADMEMHGDMHGDGEKMRLAGRIPPVGPYSAGVAAGDLVFLAGQIALDPETGALVEGGIAEQTRQVMDNLAAVLEEAGLGFGNVVRTGVFLADVNDFAAMNEVYASYFPEGAIPPARTTVAVAAIPLGALLEIDMIAVR